MDLENFPISVAEVMMFKFEDNGDIAAKALHKILLDQQSVKKHALDTWVIHIEFARLEKMDTEMSDSSF